MFRRKNKKIKLIILLGVLLWLIRSIFFLRKDVFWWIINNTLQWLLDVVEQNKPISKMFNWNTMTENIYKNALKWLEQKEAKGITASLQTMQFINSWLNITQEDILNILYNSNKKIRLATKKQVCWSIIKVWCIKNSEIEKSYQNVREILASEKEIKSDKNNALINNEVELRINNQFQIISINKRSSEIISESSLWEDIFLNWVADDSDYDLQIDIKNIWDLLFEWFIPPVETVFYNLPPSYNSWIKNKKSNKDKEKTNKEKETLSVLLQNLFNQSWPTNTWIITNWWAETTTEKWWTKKEIQLWETIWETKKQTNTFDIEDQWLKDFVKKNTITQKTNSQLQSIQWDICRDSIIAEIPTIKENEEEIDSETLKEYIENIQEQIDDYSNLTPENKIIPSVRDDPDLNYEIPDPKIQKETIEKYVNTLFDSESTSSCINDCSILEPSERIICQIQCACSAVGWPNDPDPRLINMNDMLKLKFCMIPVQNMTSQQGHLFHSVEWIANVIYSITHNLVNNWEMIKHQKTTEYLDSPIADFNFSKILSFQININRKPMFKNKSEKAKKDQKISWLELENQWKTQENLNQYRVVENYKVPAEKTIQPIIGPHEEMKWKTLDNMGNFLSKNYDFRKKLEEELNKINLIANELQKKI